MNRTDNAAAKMARLQQQMDFCLEIDKEKRIGRQTYRSDGETKENDAEHAWHLAVMALLLAEHAEEPVDLLKTVSMLLIHDLVEIYAGDTYIYDTEGVKSQKQREEAAADRLFGQLPPDQSEKFRALFEEFDGGQSPEARFARTLDRVQPLLLQAATDGKSWVERGICLSQVLGRNTHTGEGSAILWDYTKEHFIFPQVEKGHLKNQ